MALDGLDRARVLDRDEPIERADAGRLWAEINADIAQTAETAGLAAGLHFHAAAMIGEIEAEVAAISALLGRYR